MHQAWFLNDKTSSSKNNFFDDPEKQPKVKYKPQNIYVEKKTGAYTMAITILVFVRICRAWYPRILSNILHYF